MSPVDRAAERKADLATLLALLAHRRSADVQLDRLRRRKLPWTAALAVQALDGVVGRGRFDDRRATIALRAAEQVGRAGETDVALVDALVRFCTWMESLPNQDVHGLREAWLLAGRVSAATSPPDLLDLSLVDESDRWGEAAVLAVVGLDPDAIAPLVRLLGELGPRKPSQRWTRAVAEACALQDDRVLVRRWVEEAARADLVVDEYGDPLLLTDPNEDLVRAAVFASTHDDGDWVAAALGELARRAAATTGTIESLSLKVAVACVDVLAQRGGPAETAVLRELLDDLTRRDLVKRVGAALGEESSASRRDAQLKRDKAAIVRRKADPAPQRERAEVDKLIRRHVGPTLRRLGFRGTPRTWRRHHDDRVDVIGLCSAGDGRLRLELGTWFRAAHPSDDPWPVAPDKVATHHLDLRLQDDVDLEPGPAELDRLSARLGSVVVPFLDTLGVYELCRDVAARQVGLPRGIELVDGPGVDGAFGLVALAAGDLDTARQGITRSVEQAQDWAARADRFDRENSQRVLAFWRRCLQQVDEAG